MDESAIRISAGTDPGRVRANNQDSLFAGPFPEEWVPTHGRLLLVADGMGGHAAGEVASRIAVDVIKDHYYGAELPDDQEPEPIVRSGFQAANQAILREGSRNLEQYGMGTTCSALILRDDQFWICHVGDSRIYHCHGAKMDCITQDHTLLAQMIANGDVKPEEAENLSIRHILVRAMGIDPNLQLDPLEHAFTLEAGDKLLICSDGLHGVIDDARIAEILKEKSGDDAVQALIDGANNSGGPDNITAVLVERSA